MTRRDSTRARRICLATHIKRDAAGEFMICHCCKTRFDPKRDAWRADHWPIRWADGGKDEPGNLWPILERCDRETKARQDTREVAKGKRIVEKRYGVRRISRPMPGSRRSPWKRKIDGTVVPR